MYIKEVTRLVRNFYPNEYDISELYLWCNEVSAMLLVENRRIYREIILPIASDGSVLLPEGVGMEYVERVIADGRELAREDMRLFGHHIHNIRGTNGFVLPEPVCRADSARVIYTEPYQPIRLPKYQGGVTIDKAAHTIAIYHGEFVVGDVLNITMNKGASDQYKLKEIPVFAVHRSGEQTVLETSAEAIKDAVSEKSNNAVITRVVLDKTVCDAPYDGMYVDYCLAKINLYQRDSDGYSTHMAEFNNKLANYRTWLIERLPQDDGALKNWW